MFTLQYNTKAPTEATSFTTLGQAEKEARRLPYFEIEIHKDGKVVEILERYTEDSVRVKGHVIYPREVTFKAEKK